MDKNQVIYKFSIRFSLSNKQKLSCDDYKIDLTSPIHTPYIKITSGDKSIPIKDKTENLLLVGEGYSSEEDAKLDGNFWLDAIKRTFAYLKVGADFGDRAPKTIIYKGGLEFYAEKFKAKRVIHNDHGVLVYDNNPEIRLLTPGSISIIIGKNISEVSEVAITARATHSRLTDEENIAYDLFSASFFQPSVDGRFLMLMMAVETLANQKPKSKAAIQLLDKIIIQIKQSDLKEGELLPIIGGVEALKKQSVRQAGKELANKLSGRLYMKMVPEQFFAKCYALRSLLVHGNNPRPSTEEVGRHSAALELFVGDLLCLGLPDKIKECNEKLS